MVKTSTILVLAEEMRLHKGTLCTKDDVKQKGQAKKNPWLKWSFQKTRIKKSDSVLMENQAKRLLLND